MPPNPTSKAHAWLCHAQHVAKFPNRKKNSWPSSLPNPGNAPEVSSVPKKMSSKESLYFCELFRLKEPKTWFLSIFTQPNFDKLNII